MDSIIGFPDAERRQYFEEAGNRLGLPRNSIEKDFWVCWTLRELFRLPSWGEHLTFKGGTSLSKGWKLIQRFSEDIDIVVDRGFLGFGGRNSPEAAASAKGRKSRLDALKAACRKAIQDSLRPAFSDACEARLPDKIAWALDEDATDPDGQTLLFRYPQLFSSGTGYLQPQVKIELGARSDTEPLESVTLVPYLAEVFTEIRGGTEFSVRAVAPERTFWEKAMLLHEETFRPKSKPRKARLARHYYDLWCLISAGVAAKAVANPGLFDRAAQHRQIFFRQNWVDYGTLKPGALRLCPTESDMPYWIKDYADMQGEMFFGKVPAFEQILAVVRDFEQRFNEVGFGALQR